MTYLTQLGDVPVETFLAEYWQQKPLLIRQAIPDYQQFTNLITADELAGLACEVNTARLVQEHGKIPWQVTHSPFQDNDFAQLPESHWSLLVNDVDAYLPEFNALLNCFSFIPRWRIDDLMISFAVEGGSVGAHIDEYDVFLLQAHGQRRWQIDSCARPDSRYQPDLDLRILETFSPDKEWVLNPGDMLYLPPHIPHHGVALGHCMTYSIGFRAPSQQDLLEYCVEQCSTQSSYEARFQDKNRSLQTNPYQLNDDDLEQLAKQTLKHLDNETLKQSIGCYLTTSKHPDDETLISRPACYRIIDNNIQVFVQGKCYTVALTRLHAVQTFCKSLSDCDIFTQNKLIAQFITEHAPYFNR